jgi:hypothetical protein
MRIDWYQDSMRQDPSIRPDVTDACTYVMIDGPPAQLSIWHVALENQNLMFLGQWIQLNPGRVSTDFEFYGLGIRHGIFRNVIYICIA